MKNVKHYILSVQLKEQVVQKNHHVLVIQHLLYVQLQKLQIKVIIVFGIKHHVDHVNVLMHLKHLEQMLNVNHI
jgi:hypothetical protein